MSETPEFTIAKLDVHPGDTVIFRFKGSLTIDLVQQIEAYLEPRLPNGVKALILDPDTEISVMSKVRGAVA
jgi:hypothetical protein